MFVIKINVAENPAEEKLEVILSKHVEKAVLLQGEKLGIALCCADWSVLSSTESGVNLLFGVNDVEVYIFNPREKESGGTVYDVWMEIPADRVLYVSCCKF